MNPTGELPNRALSLGEWYVAHKIAMRKIVIAVLSAWNIIAVGMTIAVFGSYLLFGMTADDALLRRLLSLPNYIGVNMAIGAKQLQISNVQVFRSAQGVYTLSAGVVNPNGGHVAHVQYKFTYSGGETRVLDAILLSGAATSLSAFGVSTDSYPANAELNVLRTDWWRLSRHRYTDLAKYISDRLAFTASNFTFHPPDTSKGALVPSITFDLSNDSSYSYWRPLFYIELLNGSDIVALLPLSFDRLFAGEKRHIDVRLFGDITGATDMKLDPAINIFDPSIFIAP